MFFYSNPVNACLPFASVDGHFLFPYFENCVVTTLFSVVTRIKCGDNVVTFHRKGQKEKSLTA